MITQRIQGLGLVHFIAQVFLVVMLYWLWLTATVQWHTEPHTSFRYGRYVIFCVLIVLGLMFHELRASGYRIGVLRGYSSACGRLAFSQTLFAMALLAFYLVATKDRTISRAFLISFLPLMYVTLLASHHWLPRRIATHLFHGVYEQRTLLIGSALRARALHAWLHHKHILGMRTIGLLSDEAPRTPIKGLPVLGGTDDLERVIHENGVTHVILVEFPFFPKIISYLVQICDQLGVRLLMVDNLDEKFLHPVTYFEDDGVRFIGLRPEPLENPWNRMLKRGVDIMVSLPVVLFILPWTSLVVWLCQKFQSPGPLFYSQPRSGLQNYEFRILKYRTMKVNHGQTAKQATQNDDRIYPAGKIFRKYSIDELPQFWNVLMGHMSVVGPRPHLVEHNKQFAEIMASYHVRCYVKPGITGLAQIKGFRGETKMEEDLVRRVEWDIYYLENWSLDLDWMIIFRTFWHVVSPPKTAY